MPWYVFQLPEGPYQLYASSPQEAARLFFQQTGAAGSIATVGNGEQPIAGIPFLTWGPGGQGRVQTAIGSVSDIGGGAVGREGFEYNFPEAAFERGLQRQGQNPEGFLRNYLASLYRPAAATFQINRAMGPIPTEDRPDFFEEMVAKTPVENIRRNATEAFRTLGRPSAAASADQQAVLAGYADPYGAGLTTQESGNKIANLIALAQQAAATRYSPFAAQQLLPDAQTVRARYERGGLQGSLYDFLKQQYGLTGGF